MAQSSQTTRARFITFEGGEGVGKSTQVKRLVARLAEHGVSAIRTREPGGTPKAEAIRSFILQGNPESWGAGAEAVLFAAARLDHVNTLIAPTLDAGQWVICDRFADSTRAYQGLTDGVDEKLIDALEHLALNGRVPDLTIVLDMDPDAAFERVRQRALEDGMPALADRFEKEDIAFHRRLRDNFQSIAKAHPERCIILSAAAEEDDLAQSIWHAILDRFPEIEPEEFPA